MAMLVPPIGRRHSIPQNRRGLDPAPAARIGLTRRPGGSCSDPAGSSGNSCYDQRGFVRQGRARHRSGLRHRVGNGRGLSALRRGRAEIERQRAAGGRVVAAPGDVSRPGEAEAMVKNAIAALGRLDFLVNNAGTPATPVPIPFENLDALTEEFWSQILTTNLIGPFRCTHAAVPALKA